MRFVLVLLWSFMCSRQVLADRSKFSKTLIWQPDRARKAPEWVISHEAYGPASLGVPDKKDNKNTDHKAPKSKDSGSNSK